MRVSQRILRFSTIVFVTVCGDIVLGQSISQLWNWNIVSDYGPRKISATAPYDFHEGIDFDNISGDTDLGVLIPALESGIITSIGGNTFHNIRIQGELTGDEWLYGHIFRSPPNKRFPAKNTGRVPTGNDWELLLQAIVVNPNDTNDTPNTGVIIQWASNSTTVAKKVLIANDFRNYFVKRTLNSPFILSENSQRIHARSTVNVGENIAIMGDSVDGNVSVHLHLGLNYFLRSPRAQSSFDNPFFHLIHSPDGKPEVRIEAPANNVVFTTHSTNFDFTVNVRSRKVTNNQIIEIGGHDLDELDFWVYVNGDPDEALKISGSVCSTNKPVFGYGGFGGAGGTPGNTEVDDLTESVREKSRGRQQGAVAAPSDYTKPNGQFDTLGQDSFVVNQNITNLELPNGSHIFAVTTRDVNKIQAHFATNSVRFEVNIANNSFGRLVGSRAPFVNADWFVLSHSRGRTTDHALLLELGTEVSETLFNAPWKFVPLIPTRFCPVKFLNGTIWKLVSGPDKKLIFGTSLMGLEKVTLIVIGVRKLPTNR